VIDSLSDSHAHLQRLFVQNIICIIDGGSLHLCPINRVTRLITSVFSAHSVGRDNSTRCGISLVYRKACMATGTCHGGWQLVLSFNECVRKMSSTNSQRPTVRPASVNNSVSVGRRVRRRNYQFACVVKNVRRGFVVGLQSAGLLVMSVCVRVEIVRRGLLYTIAVTRDVVCDTDCQQPLTDSLNATLTEV